MLTLVLSGQSVLYQASTVGGATSSFELQQTQLHVQRDGGAPFAAYQPPVDGARGAALAAHVAAVQAGAALEMDNVLDSPPAGDDESSVAPPVPAPAPAPAPAPVEAQGAPDIRGKSTTSHAAAKSAPEGTSTPKTAQTSSPGPSPAAASSAATSYASSAARTAQPPTVEAALTVAPQRVMEIKRSGKANALVLRIFDSAGQADC